jgi:hypothetical protein
MLPVQKHRLTMASDEILPDIVRAKRTAEERIPSTADENEIGGFTLQTVGGVYDSAFELYKRHFGTLALIVACVFIPTQVLLHAAGNLWLRPLLVQMNSDNPDPLAVMQVGLLGFLIGGPQYGVPGYLSLLTSCMASGPVAVAVANILVGRPLNIATAYKRAVPVFWRLFWTFNVMFVIYVLVFVLVLIALVLLLGVTSAFSRQLIAVGGPELGAAFVLLMIIVPYLASSALGTGLFAFAPPLIALEQLTVLGAIERNSRMLSRRQFWRVCLAITLLPIVIFGLQYLILQSASSVVQALKWPTWAEFVVNTGLSSLINFFFQPYWMIFVTLLYFDCRVRSEGLDVRYMIDNLPELDPYLDPNVALVPHASGASAPNRPSGPPTVSMPVSPQPGTEAT